MCIYTTYIKNPKYQPNKKNNFNPPECTDERLLYVPVSCGKCFECRKKKQREWLCRLSEEIRHDNRAIFVTLTMSNESFYKLRKRKETENELMTRAVRLFLERIRKQLKHSVKHWFITELGGENGRIHIHGLMWCEWEIIEKCWQYGYTYKGTYVNEKTINYITKYMLKENENDKSFVGKVLCSAGIGRNYINRLDAQRNKYVPGRTSETYRCRNGMKIYLPQYYRNKIYSDEDKEALWIEKQEQGYRYIDGERVSVDDTQEYERQLQKARDKGRRLYNENPQEWDREKFRKRLKRMREYVNKYTKLVNK